MPASPSVWQIPAGTLTEDPNGFFEFELTYAYHIEIVDAHQILALFQSVSKEPLTLLLDHRPPHSLSFSAQRTLLRTKRINRVAVLVRPGLNAEMARLVSTVNRTAFPTEIFLNKENAKAWLIQHMDQSGSKLKGMQLDVKRRAFRF